MSPHLAPYRPADYTQVTRNSKESLGRFVKSDPQGRGDVVGSIGRPITGWRPDGVPLKNASRDLVARQQR